MTQDEMRPCPEAETLAAFLDGTLSDEERQTTLDHIRECNHCIWVLRETAADERVRTASPGWRRAFVIAAGIVIAVTAAIAVVVRSRSDTVSRLALVAHQTGVRTYEGRLERFTHARYRSTRSMASVDAAISAAAQAVLDESATSQSARDWHARGVAYLLTDDSDAAVNALATAVRLSPATVSYQNDLAAARIELGTARGDSEELLRALGNADAALAATPRDEAALFNRALALERLGRRNESLRAYEAYLAIDARSPWAAEVRWRIDRLRG